MKPLADITAAQLQEMGIVRQEEIAVYRYGFDALYTALLQMASIFCLALVVGNFFETFLSPLSRFAFMQAAITPVHV